MTQRGRPGRRWTAWTAGALAALAWAGGGHAATLGPPELVSKADPGFPGDTGGNTSSISQFGRAVSADGRFVVFTSTAPNLIPGQTDTNNSSDVFLFDRLTGTVTLVSHVPGVPSTTGDGLSVLPTISADGAYVAFTSRATNLVVGFTDGNGPFAEDLFLYERATGTVTLVSHVPGVPGTSVNSESSSPRISADGAYVAFESGAQVYLYERATDTVTLVSHIPGAPSTPGNGGSNGPEISADGAYVAFESGATNLVAGTTGGPNVYLYERATGTVTLVSHVPGLPGTNGNNSSFFPTISADGAYVAFTSRATNLVAGSDTNNSSDVFLYERATGTVTLVSHRPGLPGTTGNSGSEGFGPFVAISGDGAYVAFVSSATNLVAGSDTNGGRDVFLYTRATGTVALVSHIPGFPGFTGSGASDSPTISADGAFVAFRSGATNLVAGADTNGGTDVFHYARATGTVTLVSHVPGAPSTSGNGAASAPVISGDGAYVAFQANASNLTDADFNGVNDVFLFERASGANLTVSRRLGLASASAGGQSLPGRSVSADGRFVVFTSVAPNLVPGQADTNNLSDVFLFDRVTGTTALVSHVPGLSGTTGNGASDLPVISGDGAYVAFRSLATNLVVGSDGNGHLDVFLYQQATGTVTLVSHVPGVPGTTGNERSEAPVISGDGAFVAFQSNATNLVAGTDGNGLGLDVFLYARATGTVTLVSHVLGAPGTTGNGASNSPVISADGAYVAFVSNATNLVAGFTDLNSGSDLFLYERATGTVTLVSHAAGLPGTTGNAGSQSPVVSGDGAYVAFMSSATNLVAGTVGGNVYLYERATGTVTLVSHVPGLPGTAGNGASSFPVISGDGAYVAFTSSATNLVAGTDANGREDVFVYERATGTVTLVSHVPGLPGTTGNERSEVPVLSGNGGFVAFRSLATNLVAGADATGSLGFDVFLYERATGTVTLVSHVPGLPGTTGNAGSDRPVISEDGTAVVFSSLASNLVAADFNLTTDVFAAPIVADTTPSDTTPPNTTITASPASPTSATNATFTFTGNDDVTPPGSLTFECRLDGGGFVACASPASYPGPLADGSHTFEVRARDAAGLVDPTPASFTWMVDTTPPDTTITGGPSGLTTSGSASLTFTTTEPGTFECQLDGGAWTGCASPTSYSGLADGPHTFGVRAGDAAGNIDPTPATRAWAVDTTLPTITITTPANATSYLRHQAVSASYACTDASGVTLCTGPVASGALIDTATVGPKTFRVDATDEAGNSHAVTHTYTVVYGFTGFFQPVDNLPVYNQVNAGRAIPVRFSLGGDQGLGIFAPGYPASVAIGCSTSVPVDTIEETVTAGSSTLTYDPTSDQYHYVWKTSGGWGNSCRQLIIRLNDGTDHLANFKFK